MNLMIGEELSQKIKNELKQEIKSYMIKPCVTVIQLGNDIANNNYIQAKVKACNEVGIYLKHINFPDDVKEIEVINKIVELNNDDYVNGIILQLPIPEKFNQQKLINYIARNKDIDGLTDLNLGKIWNGKKTLVSCVPQAILELCDFYQIPLEGKHVVIINRSSLVGKPLLGLLLNRDATVTVCHSKTKNIDEYTKQADIIITAVGKKNFIVGDMIKKDAVIFDVGNFYEDGKIYGDVDFNSVKDKALYITPTPGGIGPVTITMMLKNVVDAYKKMNIEK